MKNIPCWQLAGFVFSSVLGTFLHFLFDLTGGSVAAALVSAVNESIWEHMKLLYYPMLAFAFLEYRTWGRQRRDFWWVKLLGTALGLLLVPVLYYTYSGILGIHVDWVNITIFFLAAMAAYRVETALFARERAKHISGSLALGLLLAMAAVFTMLTFFPPEVPFFRDPVTGTYGFLRENAGNKNRVMIQ